MRKTLSYLSAAICFGVLFIAMFPVERLASQSALVVGCVLLVAILAIWLIWRGISASEERANMTRIYANDQRLQGTIWQKALCCLYFSLPCIVAWTIFLYIYWPGYFTPIINILALALLWGWAMCFFETHGIPPKILWPATWLFTLIPFNGNMLVRPAGELLYPIASFMLVFLLGQVWLSRGAWLISYTNRVFLGLAIVLPFLLQPDGLWFTILAAGLLSVTMILSYPRLWKAILFVATLAVGFTLAINRVLPGVQQINETFGLLAPIRHINAVLKIGGAVNHDSEAVLERLAPLAVWKNPNQTKTPDTQNELGGAILSQPILDELQQNQRSLIRIYLNLARRYPLIVLRSELDLINIAWNIVGSQDEQIVAPGSLREPLEAGHAPNDEPYVNSRQPSAIRQALDGFLNATAYSPMVNALFWRGGLYLFLITLLAGAFIFLKGWDGLILFIPAFTDVLWLAMLVPEPDFRFVYPYVLPIFLITIFVLLARAPAQKSFGEPFRVILFHLLWLHRRTIAYMLLVTLAFFSVLYPLFSLTAIKNNNDPLTAKNRFECLRGALPAEVRVIGFHPFYYFNGSQALGTETDQQADWVNNITLARYALAPMIITEDSSSEWEIAYFINQQAGRQVIQNEGWHIVKDCQNSVFLLHR
jgi:hypothetical protein